MSSGEVAEAFVGGTAAGEIKLLQGAFDPDVHREGAIEAVGEEEDAVGDFAADAAEFHEFETGGGVVHGSDFFEVEGAVGDLAGGGEEAGGTEAHFAGS